VSAFGFGRQVLARAQAPGVNAETRVLAEARGAEGLDPTQADRARDVTLLTGGSRLQKGPLSIVQFKPVGRFDLDLALGVIQKEAAIPAAAESTGQAALLLVRGGVERGASTFCRDTLDTPSTGAVFDWVRQVRSAFILELWDEAAYDAFQKSGRAEVAQGAPEGVFHCRIGGASGGKISLYGLAPAALKDDTSRIAIFSWLTARAVSLLKP
jgi:hypothetical protein